MIWLFGEDTELGEGANFGSGRGTGDGLEKTAGSESSRGVGSGRKRGKWRNNAWYFLFEKGLKRRKPSRKFKVREEGGWTRCLSPLFCHPCKTGHFRDVVTAMTWEGISSFVFLVKNVFTKTKSTNRNFTMNACFITVFLIVATKEIFGKKKFTNSEDVQADYKGKKKLYCGLKL